MLPHTDAGGASEEDLLLLADAQTPDGLLEAGEPPGAPVIGELARRRDSALIIRQPRNRAASQPDSVTLQEPSIRGS